MNQASAPSKKLKRNWFQFRLTSILIAGTIVLVAGAFLRQPIAIHSTIAWVEENEGGVGVVENYAGYLPLAFSKVYFVDLSLGKELKNLKPLARLPDLTELHIEDREVRDFSGLEDLNNLTYLRMSFSNIKDLSPLSQLNSLIYLDLSNTAVEDLQPLERLPRLKKLLVGGTGIRELDSVVKIKSLKTLDITACPNITKEQIYQFIKQRPDMSVYYVVPLSDRRRWPSTTND